MGKASTEKGKAPVKKVKVLRDSLLGIVLSSVGGCGSGACDLGTHGDVYLVEWVMWMICILLESLLDL